MKILICNAGSYLNKGDGAILVSMIDTLLDYFPDIKIDVAGSIVSYINAERESSLKSKQIKFVNLPGFVILGTFKSFLLSKFDNKKKIPFKKKVERSGAYSRYRLFYHYLHILKSYLILFDAFVTSFIPKKMFQRFFTISYKRKNVDIFSYDAFIVAGGTQFEDKEYFGYPGFASNLPVLGTACAAKIPFFITGQSIGPIKSSLGRFVVRRMLNKASGICLREEFSQKYVLNNLSVKNKIETGSDWAFLLSDINDDLVKKYINQYFFCSEKRKVLIIPRRVAHSKKAFEQYLIKLAEIADRLVAMNKVEVLLFPQTIDSLSFLHDDLKTCFEIKRIMKNQIGVVDTSTWTIKEIARFLSGVDLLITCRMHALIMAAAGGGTPGIIISHIHKFRGIAIQLGLNEFLLDNYSFSADEVISKVVYAFNNIEKINKNHKNCIQKIKEKAFKNVNILWPTLTYCATKKKDI